MKKILIVAIVLLLGIYLCSNDNNKIKDDFYQEINKEAFLDYKLKSNEYSNNRFSKVQEIIDKETDNIVVEMINNDNNVKLIHDKIVDSKTREITGINELMPYINKVFKATNTRELLDIIIEVEEELGIDLITSIEIMPDYKDNSHNIIYFVPVSYAFDSSTDYINNPDYMSYKAYLKRACIRLWTNYGMDKKDAREVVDRLFIFYEDIAKYSKSNSEFTSIDEYYNIVSLDDIKGIMGEYYLSRKGIDGYNRYSLVDKGQYEYLFKSLNMDNLEVFKYMINTKVLSSYAYYSSDSYMNIVTDLNNSILGVKKEKNIEEVSSDIIKNIYTKRVDNILLDRHNDSKVIDEVSGMFNEIKSTYIERLKNNKWLSKGTRDKAIDKLEKMNIIIGSNNSSSEIKIEISNDSLIRDVININKLNRDYNMSLLDSNKKEDIISQSIVNAYYQPLDNSIVIPIAFLKLIDNNSNYYEKLGTLGMILAHEVTHAFDSNGAKFDSRGNLNNWWSDSDISKFNRKRDEVIKYYNRYEVLNGKYINGEKTSNENIADLGALNCLMDILEKRGATKEEYRSLFEAYAKLWISVDSDDYMELLLLNDSHAPNKYRVNAVISSLDKFYEVYGIRPWNKMWIDKSKRVSVW